MPPRSTSYASSAGHFPCLNSKEKKWGVLFALFLGISLSQSFLPAIHQLIHWIPAPSFRLWPFPEQRKTWEMIAFPITALLFYFSIPQKKHEPRPANEDFPWHQSLFLPLGISIAFGAIRHFAFGIRIESLREDIFWYVILIPVAEESLFRGWLYQIVQRIYGVRFFTATNPLPTSIWLSSIAFALWHFQNISNSQWAFVFFQLVYTFFTGMWLGYLRWKTGKITIPIIAHSLLNLGAMLALFL